jgi:hypothetical protein
MFKKENKANLHISAIPEISNDDRFRQNPQDHSSLAFVSLGTAANQVLERPRHSLLKF